MGKEIITDEETHKNPIIYSTLKSNNDSHTNICKGLCTE